MSLDRRGCELPLDWCVEPYNPLCCPFLLQLRLFVLICLHRAPIAMVVFLFHIRRSHLPFSATDFSSFISLFFLYLCPWHTHNLFYSSPSIFSVFFSSFIVMHLCFHNSTQLFAYLSCYVPSKIAMSLFQVSFHQLLCLIFSIWSLPRLLCLNKCYIVYILCDLGHLLSSYMIRSALLTLTQVWRPGADAGLCMRQL